MALKITDFKKIDKGVLYGKCSARIDAWHMELRDITIFIRSGEMSFALPSRQFETADGKKAYFSFIKLDESANGKLQVALRLAMDEYLKELVQKEEPKAVEIDGCPF